MNELNELLQDHQNLHSDFQMDNLITIEAGGPTAFGQYKQALRELNARRKNLLFSYNEIERLRLTLDGLKNSSSANDPLVKLDIEKLELQIECAEDLIANTEREFLRFFAQAKALKTEIGELTEEKRAELDRKLWFSKITNLPNQLKNNGGERFKTLKTDKAENAKELIKASKKKTD